MIGFLTRRIAGGALLLLFVVSLLFVVLDLAPGGPSVLLEDPSGNAAQKARVRELYGLDRPLGERYVRWLGAALRGDWGVSFVHRRPVARVIGEALPATLLLAVAALVVELLLGLVLGIAAARHQDGKIDQAIRLGSLVFFSMPVFWLGLMAILLFSYTLGLLPPSHMRSVGAQELGTLARLADLAKHLVLPATVLGVATSAVSIRLLRNSLVEVLQQDYIRAARARGLSERRVLWTHGLRNAAVPLLQLYGQRIPALLNGSLIIEVIFAWPGLGRLIYTAVLTRDYPLVLASTAFSGALVIVGILITDLLHAAVDPRVRRA